MRMGRLLPVVLLALAAPTAGPAERAQPPAVKAPLGRQINALKETITRRRAPLTRQQRLDDPWLAQARLRFHKAQLLMRAYRPSVYREARILKELEAGRAAAQRIGKGRDPKAVVSGFQEKAYLSGIDYSPQPYLVYVPTTYDGRKPVGLLIFLHGYAYDLNRINWIDYMYSKDMERLAEKLGFIALLPFGRSNTEFMDIGEADVLHTIRLVKREYRIDEDRVILSGASMGGTGAYTIACHYPHEFAGVFTITGRVDYYQWMRVAKSALPTFKQVQTDLDYPRELLANLAHIPVFIFHGEKDRLLKVGQSRRMFKLLKELKQPVKYKELAGLGHHIWSNVFTDPDLADWLRERSRAAVPRRVVYRTYTLKYNRAYWVTLDRLERWGSRADVTAEVLDAGRLRVETENVAALRVVV